MEIYYACSFESSKELNYNTANIYPTIDSTQIHADDDQSNFKDTEQSEEPNEEEAPELELKPLLEELKYAYLREQQTYPVVIFSQLTLDQECNLLSVLQRHKTAFGWTLKDIKSINSLICTHRIHLEENTKTTRQHRHYLCKH